MRTMIFPVLLSLLASILLASCCRCPSPSGSASGYDCSTCLCKLPYFQPVGDLPGDLIEGGMNDVSADGLRGVGYSSADDPLVSTDGPATGCPHSPQAQAYMRSCAGQQFFPPGGIAVPGFPPGNNGLGLIGLGYFPSTGHAESIADGISPDGKVVVGYSTTAPGNSCGVTGAVVFKGTSIVALQTPAPFTISRAYDVTDTWAGGGTGSASGPFAPGNRIAVGYLSTNGNHPHRYVGGLPAYWDATGTPHELGVPAALPGGEEIRSAEAISVSDDGEVIVGNLYYGVENAFRSYACAWSLNASGAYDPPFVLADVAGGEPDARTRQVSGNGHVIVGYGADSGGSKALRWLWTAGAWDPVPAVLPMIPGGTMSFALGVNTDGSVIVGSCDAFDVSPALHFAARWTASGVESIAELLVHGAPSVNIPSGWQIQASRVSADGRTFVGTAVRPDPAVPNDPDAFLVEGWMARIP